MKSKLGFLTGISLKRKIKSKWFAIANILIAIVVIALINIDSIISFFGGDFNEKTNIYLVDSANSYEIFKNEIEQNEALIGNDESSYNIILSDDTVDNLKEKLKTDEDRNSIILNIKPSEENTIDVTMITREYMDLIDSQVITNSINNTKVALAIKNSSISVDELNNIYKTIDIDRQWLEEGKNSTDENMSIIMTTVFPIVILPFFLLTLFLVQMIGAEVNDEKTTRGMEIIISNVSPKTHFFSKVIAGNLFVLIQGALLVIYALIAFFIRDKIGASSIAGGIGSEISNVIGNLIGSEVISKLVYIIPVTLVLMLLTFISYSLLAGILASMTTNIEDFQQLQTPIMVISLVGYYLATMSGMFEGSIFIKVLSFVPLISAILSPCLLMLGQIGIIEVIISILLTIILNFFLIKYGLRIYKVGILNYSSKGLWKKMFKAMKS